MAFSANAVLEPPARMDPQNQDDIRWRPIVVDIKMEMEQCWERPLTYTIFRIPDFDGIDERIRSPQLASFGPHHSGKDRLHGFEKYKERFLSKFLSRSGRDRHFYELKLKGLNEKTKGCYHEDIVMPSDDKKLVDMMLRDGSFMVELFRLYEEDSGRTWAWTETIHTLIADLLNLENQLPFFILEELFKWSGASTSTLPTLALRFLNQALCSPPDIKDPKHLLDLFRSSLLPSTETYPQQSRHPPDKYSIQCVKQLRSAGITLRQKTAKSILEIDFRKFQIPPLALKIPSVAIDDFTSTILVNCVALEQCLQGQSQHFTAYVCFMNCLMKQPEDVGFLRSVEIFTRVLPDETCFIRMLNSLGTKVWSSFKVRDCYLWEQFWEIHSYYNSCWASIRRNFFNYNNMMLYCSILQIAVGILIWRLSANSSTSSDPN